MRVHILAKMDPSVGILGRLIELFIGDTSPLHFWPPRSFLKTCSWGSLLDTKNDRGVHLFLISTDLISSLLLPLTVFLKCQGKQTPISSTWRTSDAQPRNPSTSYFNSIFYYFGDFKQISSRTTFLIWKRETTPVPPFWISWWMRMVRSPCSSNSHSFCCYQYCNWTMVAGGN